MIINLHFGYKNRHHIYYDTQLKRGTINLWTSQNGFKTGSVPVENDEDLLSGLLTRQESGEGLLFGANQHTEFQIADEKDMHALLASLAAVTNGCESSFTNKEGRKIALSLDKQEKRKKEVITVNIQYSKAGKLTIGEARKLQTIIREILNH